MKVRVSDLLGNNSSYWYQAKEEYEVEKDTAINYKVIEGEHKGKIIYHAHCKIIQ